MEKTTKNGIHRITQAGGKTIAWAEESGVKVLEKDGYYFKDLAKTGELLPYETGVFPMRRERQTLRVVFRLKRLQALCCTRRTRRYRRCRADHSRERLTEKRISNPAKSRMPFLTSRRNFWRTTHPSYSADECRKPGNLRKVEQ